MPVKLLVKVNEKNYVIPEDPDKDRAGVWKTGYVVEQRADTWTPGGKEVPPKFICVRITNLDDVSQYLTPWHVSMSYEVLNSDPAIDGFRIRATAEFPGVTNRGAITRAMVEGFLNKWNASVVSATTNSVTFDVAIYSDGVDPGALQSEGFWDFNPSDLIFEELDYNQTTGEHQLEVDYADLSITDPNRVESIITGKGGVILNHDTVNHIIQFSIGRDDVNREFRGDVKQKTDKVLYRRQYYLDPVWVQDICDNYSGYVEVTAAQLLTHLGNKLNDDATTLDTHSLLI